MKLITKTTINFFIIACIVFFISGIAAYSGLRHILNSEIDETLHTEKFKITAQLNNINKYPRTIDSDLLSIKKLKTKEIIPFSPEFSDTSIYDPYQKEDVLYRQISFIYNNKGNYYLIKIRRSAVEKEDIIRIITYLMAGLFLLITILLGSLNYLSDKKIWKPFYNTLNRIRKFDITKSNPLHFTPVNISEFEQLNSVLEKMTEKLRRDYENLKEFSQNAAHEMQTPLAVIKSKLEMLIQDNRLDNSQISKIQGAYKAATRLANLNSALNLLTKIDNQEFSVQSEVNLGKIIEDQLDTLNEILDMKGINITKNFISPVYMKIHPVLAEILISNLLANAIKHNITDGYINIKLSAGNLVISNSGKPLKLSPTKLFERFKKGDQSSESPGLGLAIVKKICNRNDIQIEYLYHNNEHTFNLTF